MHLRTINGIMAIILGIVIPLSASAQTDYSSRTATRSLTVGPSANFGASMTIQPPEFFKVSPVFAYQITAAASYPLTPVIGASLELGIEGRGTKLRNFEESQNYTASNVTYFSIVPSFTFSAFRLGLNLGVPVGAVSSRKLGPDSEVVTTDFTDAAMDNVAFLLEPRIGATILLLEDETGWLGLNINAGFSLNELFDRSDDEVGDNNSGDFHMVAGYLGVTYQFAIPGTAHK